MNNCTVLCVTGRGKRRLWKGGPSLSKGQGLGEARIWIGLGWAGRNRDIPPVVSCMALGGSAGKDWMLAAVHCDPSVVGSLHTEGTQCCSEHHKKSLFCVFSAFGLCEENGALLLAVPPPLQLQTLLLWWSWCCTEPCSRHCPSPPFRGQSTCQGTLSVCTKSLALLKPTIESLRLERTSKVNKSNL